MTGPRYLVGIDLGTTNSAVAYVDLEEEATRRPRVRLLHVPQVVAPGETAPRDVLPSFLYFPTEAELAGGGLRLPWARDPSPIVGVFAREQGALMPTRQVASAKSWLSNPAADRAARILPWGAEEPLISPVEASSRILAGLRDAWDHVVAGDAAGRRLERQAVVLTVPASFDQEARELTLDAARAAGLEQVTLLEEPLAAFYAWIGSHRPALKKQLRDGQQLLVCDVGGGTTDFTLVTVTLREGRLSFERTAVGEHLLLGGDNLDLALARRIEQRFGDRALTLVQRLALRRSVSAAKERLLTEPGCERVAITILGSGRAVVGGSLAAELTRDEVVDALREGFLPLVPADARPSREKRRGLRELGLPYAEDAAITRHLAAFLELARAQAEATSRAPGGGPGPSGGTESAERRAHGAAGMMLRPDAILFNGGFFTPPLARERVVEAIARWFDPGGSWRPEVLENRAPAAAVALGAASYALVRRGGDGLRVRAGSARGYYIGVAAGTGEDRAANARLERAPMALCILPRGTEEGTAFDLSARRFAVVTNRPVSFPLFSSATRRDAAGDIVELDEESAHEHAPLTTVLRYGRKSRHAQIDVSLGAAYTETGTLEVACASRETDHRWALRFQLRGEREAADVGEADEGGEEAGAVIPPDRLDAAAAAIDLVFGPSAGAAVAAAGHAAATGDPAITAETLPARLESILGFARQAWPLAAIRVLADRLIEHADGRRRAARHEARWLNLLGFCLRPGFGAELDDWRIGRTRSIYAEGLVFATDLQCQAEWIVMWQRVAGGLRAGQQRELYNRYATLLEVKSGRRPKRLNAQIEREGWRLLASLEHLSARERVSLGNALLDRLQKEPENASYLWAIGRLGARVPAYGPATAVVPAEHAETWIERLFQRGVMGSERAGAIAQIGARSDDPLRDISETARAQAIDRLSEAGFTAQAEQLRTFVQPAARDALQVFGESLPQGLRLL